MISRLPSLSTTYQVALRGRLGPAYRAALAAAGARRPATTSVFLLPASAGADVTEVFALLRSRGLVVLEVRRAPGAQDGKRHGTRSAHPPRVMPLRLPRHEADAKRPSQEGAGSQ